jgi:outer membrane protein TolC
VFAIEDLDVKRKSLRLTKATLEQTRAQVEAGLLAPIEITRVRADVATQEGAILTAQKSVEDKEDLLRRFINQKSSRLVEDMGVVPLERTAYQPVEPDLDREVRQALFYRPDYLSAKLAIESRDIELAVAKNARLPVVDLSATLSLNGLGATTSSSLDQLATGDFPDWTGAVAVEIPLGNRLAKAEYFQARMAKVKSLLELKNLEYDIVINVKQGVRQVLTNLKNIRSTRLARDLAEERLRAEEEKFNVGTALILDVLDAQTKLAQAESAERQAIVDYNKSLISLEKFKGTLLERNRVYLSEDAGPPSPEE